MLFKPQYFFATFQSSSYTKCSDKKFSKNAWNAIILRWSHQKSNVVVFLALSKNRHKRN